MEVEEVEEVEELKDVEEGISPACEIAVARPIRAPN